MYSISSHPPALLLNRSALFLRLIILGALAVSGVLRAEGLVYEEPPLGPVNYLPYVYTEKGLKSIVDYKDYVPVLEDEGKKKNDYKPTYVFVPTARKSLVRVTNLRSKTRDLVTNFSSTLVMRSDDRIFMEAEFNLPSNSMRGVCIVSEDKPSGANRITGFKVGPANPGVATEFSIKVGTFAENYQSASRIYTSLLFFDDQGLVYVDSRLKDKLAALSNDYYARLTELYLKAKPQSGPPKLLNAEMIATPASFPETALGRPLRFRLSINEAGQVIKVTCPTDPELNESILRQVVQALFTWRALPAIKEGRAVSAQIIAPVVFKK